MKTLVGSVLVVFLVGGCAMVGPGASPSATPWATAPPTTAPPTVSDSPQPTPTDEGALAVPPAAVLTLADGTQQAAKTGSYCYQESCSDAPFWPTAASMTRVDVPAGATTLSVTIPDGPAFVYWRARYAAHGDHFAETLYPLDEGGDVDGQQPLTEAQLAPPPSGEWLLEVSVSLANDEGDVNYYWYVAVP